tara:strand:+ start:6321 stop:7343 length:1023 start_codon:yes stop_codon:yes gene_type:complete
MKKKKILLTGVAGFIGFHCCSKLLNLGYLVYGIDNINDYYDINLKYARLEELGLKKHEAKVHLNEVKSIKFNNLKFKRIDLSDNDEIDILFQNQKFDMVCNLAAQAGVRYSIDNPNAYINSNINGFLNILEGCRKYNVKHLVYASSSSVYGKNKKIPFEITDNVDNPISLYAATKKSNELMAHTYGHLFGFKTTGLRFFTVYGPWGRPDMAYYLFANAITKNKPIKVFNNGNMRRDFIYIDDIILGIVGILEKNVDNRHHYKIYNIGNNKTENIEDLIKLIEKNIGKKAVKKMYPIQPGDVPTTFANVDALKNDIGYTPNTSIEDGLKKFIDWFMKYHNF